jgi:hypothetical protein
VFHSFIDRIFDVISGHKVHVPLGVYQLNEDEWEQNLQSEGRIGKLGNALNIDRTGDGSKSSLDRPTGSSVSVTS